MENNITNSLSKIKQPKPSIGGEEEKRKFNFPNVGVISTPKISNTPIMDAYIKSANENPQIKYVVEAKNNNFFDVQNIISTSIVALGAVSLVKLVRQFFKK